MNDNEGGPLALSDAGPKGRGVFASRSYRRGDGILAFGGPLIPIEDVADFTHVIQVDADLFLGASGRVDDYVNHSCDPNSGLHAPGPSLDSGSGQAGLALRALRTIRPGEEVTFDYSTCMMAEPALDHCWCESPRCRGRVVAFWDLSPATRRRYERLGAVPEFVLQGRPARSAGSRPKRLPDEAPLTASPWYRTDLGGVRRSM